jgi:ABC-2 type transport system permease protein
VLPISAVVGMGFVFGGPERPLFKVGVVTTIASTGQAIRSCTNATSNSCPSPMRPSACRKVDTSSDRPARRPCAACGALLGEHRFAERLHRRELLLAAAIRSATQPVTGAAVRYVDWLFPGILGMNMMFSCLFGVGYVVLRYRKSGFLKRLHATPLTAFEFLSAQSAVAPVPDRVRHRILYVGVGPSFTSTTPAAWCSSCCSRSGRTVDDRARPHDRRAFRARSWWAGMLNLMTWPMMLVSGIWFSLEGSPRWVQSPRAHLPAHPRLDAPRVRSC